MARAAVALGSNLGDRRGILRQAVAALAGYGHVLGVSSLYETAPVGGPEQGPYLNAVAVLETERDAFGLMEALLAIEHDFGRERIERWGPRTIDLDLILYDAEVVEAEGLSVPHPRYRERRFVLEPLLEVWPDARHPDGSSLDEALETVRQQELRRVEGPGWDEVGEPSRGASWVVAQMVVLLAAWTPALFTGGQIESPALRVVGGALLVAGLVQLGAAFLALGDATTPYPEPLEGAALVERGIYRLVRHPMYGAVIVLTVGWSLALGSAAGLVVWASVVVFFVFKADHEERRLEATYPGYASYRARVRKRFVPWVA